MVEKARAPTTRRVAKKLGRHITPKARDWQRRLQSVLREWRVSQTQDHSRPNDRPSSALKRGIYSLAKDLVEQMGNKAAAKLVEGLGHRISVSENQHSALFLGLLNAIPDDQLARSEKHRYANELAYARRHKVPVELLIGFLLQVGAGQRIKQLVDKPSHVEPWFRKGDQLMWRSEALEEAESD